MAENISFWGDEIGGKFLPTEPVDKLSAWLFEKVGPVGRYAVKKVTGKDKQRLVQSDRETMNKYLQPLVESYMGRHPKETYYNMFGQDKIASLMTQRDDKLQYAAGIQSLKDAIDNNLIDYVDIWLQNEQMRKETAEQLKAEEKARETARKANPNALFQEGAEGKNSAWLKFYQDRISGNLEPPTR